MGIIDFQNGLLLGLSTKGRTIKKIVSGAASVLSLETRELPYKEAIPRASEIVAMTHMDILPCVNIQVPEATVANSTKVNGQIFINVEVK